jgi:CRISPR system Cascade subunit CasE
MNTPAPSPLYLMHCQPDLLRLTVWAARHGLNSPQGDLGYALHALLTAAFGDAAPQPFAYQGERGGLLGLTQMDSAALAEHAALAAPDVAGALGLDAGLHGSGLSVRAYPQQWRRGAVVGFELRVRPVLRQQGRERDVFLVEVERAAAKTRSSDGAPEASSAPGREAVYLRWLSDQFVARGAARLIDARMTRFQLTEVLRRTQTSAMGAANASAAPGRRPRQVGGPDAVFAGHLQVDDPTAFAALVTRGVGRHRAFGFGMLLLRPASAANVATSAARLLSE